MESNQRRQPTPTSGLTHECGHLLTHAHTYMNIYLQHTPTPMSGFFIFYTRKKKSLSLRVDQYVKFSRNILESHLLTEMSRGQS